MCNCHCDYDPPSAFSQTQRKARRLHTCSECGRIIQVGEQYLRTWGAWSRHQSTFNWCQHCEAAADIMKSIDECHCILFGGLWEHMDEVVASSRDRDLHRLNLGARRRWAVKRGPRKGELMPIPKLRVREEAGR